MNRELKTSHHPVQQLDVCSICLVTLKIIDDQSSSPEKDRNSRLNSLKVVSEDRSPSRD